MRLLRKIKMNDKMKNIKLFDPFIGKEEELAIKKTLRSKFWASGSGVGHVAKFEKEFKKYTGSKQCIAVNNGTSALHLALSLLDIKNKEVIVPSLSFVSSAHAIIYNGGKPIFADVDPQTLCINPSHVEQLITKKTAAIIPVHFGGMSCNMKMLGKILKNHNIPMIEDAAHAAGTKFQGKMIGSHSFACCFSFHPVKNLAMPTGGAITLNSTNSNHKKNLLNSRRWCGISNRRGAIYDVDDLGWNFYMNEFSAAIGLVQLKKLNSANTIRKKIAKQYSKELKIESKMQFDNDCSYHLYWIHVKNRKKFMKLMLEKGIQTGIHYLPIHKMNFYSSKLRLPITENSGKHIVSIPIHPNLLEYDIEKIIKFTNKFAN